MKLYCELPSASQRVYSVSTVEKQGDQIALRATRPTPTSKIYDLKVLPVGVDPQ